MRVGRRNSAVKGTKVKGFQQRAGNVKTLAKSSSAKTSNFNLRRG
jgi:hypothetical protein